MKLYGYWRSSASWRVRWALGLKGVAFEYVPVNLLKGEHSTPEHLRRNPQGLVPVLEIEPGLFLAESVAIIEWLDETLPRVPLYPGSPLDRARIRRLCEIVNSGTAPLQTPRVQKRHSSEEPERAAWAREFIHAGLQVYDQVSRPWRGDYSFGMGPSAADLFLVPQVYNALRYGVDMKGSFPELLAIYERALATPACQTASPERQPDAQR